MIGGTDDHSDNEVFSSKSLTLTEPIFLFVLSFELELYVEPQYYLQFR